MPPGATSTQHGTELIFEGDQNSINVALTTLQFKAAVNGAATINVALDDVAGNIVDGKFTAQTACFAAGTRIATPCGETAVEDLREGDLVRTLAGAERVRWIGHRGIDLSTHPCPREVRPIRLRRNSIAEGAPVRDLLVSPDHAVFIDGVLIPARLLVNGATIVQDNGFDAIRYFHVKLDRHAILLANGLAAESYLDTGNSGMFDNAEDAALTADGGQRRREEFSCAELVTDAIRVESIWRRLAARAEALGFSVSLPTMIDEPELHVLADGRVIPPIAQGDGRHAFVFPALTRDARLVSRAAAPCEARPWIEDRRRLGVMVRRLSVRRGGSRSAIALDHPGLRHGWWAVERDGGDLWRWTDGDAALPAMEVSGILEVEVGQRFTGGS